MTTVKGGNLAVKFLLELGAIAAFAYWGAASGAGPLSVALAIVTPAVAIVAWGVLAAPKSDWRLALHARVLFELAFFGLAVLALVAAGSYIAAVVFGAVVVVNAVLLTALDQWPE